MKSDRTANLCTENSHDQGSLYQASQKECQCTPNLIQNLTKKCLTQILDSNLAVPDLSGEWLCLLGWDRSRLHRQRVLLYLRCECRWTMSCWTTSCYRMSLRATSYVNDRDASDAETSVRSSTRVRERRFVSCHRHRERCLGSPLGVVPRAVRSRNLGSTVRRAARMSARTTIAVGPRTARTTADREEQACDDVPQDQRVTKGLQELY